MTIAAAVLSTTSTTVNLPEVVLCPAFIQNIGMGEWIIILIIMLLLFGRRLPEVGKSLGKGIVEFKKGIKGVEDDVESQSSRPSPAGAYPQPQNQYAPGLQGQQQYGGPAQQLPPPAPSAGQQPYPQQQPQGYTQPQPYPQQGYPAYPQGPGNPPPMPPQQ